MDYQSYKPWLRDEFQFRCVYCLSRERWFPDGDEAFSIDHLQPKSAAPERIHEYDNLVYACCHCHSAKQDIRDILGPFEHPFGQHLEALDDGTIRGLSLPGTDLIKICRLDRPKLTEFRRRMLNLFRMLDGHTSREASQLRRKYFGYPENLPRLTSLRPPGGNRRTEGLTTSYFEQLEHGELPETY